MSFSGKVVIITGASSGIGANTTRDFSKLGASLVVVGRNLENLLKVVGECESPEKVLAIKADVTNEADTKKIIDETIKRFSQIDVLVNNAGILEMGTIETTNLEQYDRVMNTNMRSIYHLTMLAVPHLIKTEGSIVNVSSVNGIRSFPGVLAYNISKAAVDQFTRCVALELASKKVRVNSVNPGELEKVTLSLKINDVIIILGVVVTNIHKNGGMDEETMRSSWSTARQPTLSVDQVKSMKSQASSLSLPARLPASSRALQFQSTVVVTQCAHVKRFNVHL